MFYCNFGNVHDIVPLFLRVLRRTKKKTSFTLWKSRVQGVKSRKTQGALLLARSQAFNRLQLFNGSNRELIYLLLCVEHL
jgi:hypothetical protein